MTNDIKQGDRVMRIKTSGAHPRWQYGHKFTVARMRGEGIGRCAVEADHQQEKEYDHNISGLRRLPDEMPEPPVTGTDEPASVQPGKALKIEYADGTTAYALISHVIPPKPPAASISAGLGRKAPEPGGMLPVMTGLNANGFYVARLARPEPSPIGWTAFNADDLREAAHYFNQVAEWLDWANKPLHEKDDSPRYLGKRS